MEQTFTYQEETVTVLTDWRFPCVTQSDNSLALMTVLREVGTVLSTMCFLCPDTLSMESVKKKDQTDSMIKISQSVLELHWIRNKNKKFLKSKFLRFSLILQKNAVATAIMPLFYLLQSPRKSLPASDFNFSIISQVELTSGLVELNHFQQ